METRAPIITKTPLTDEWVVITKWKLSKTVKRPDGSPVIEAVERFNVDDQMEAIIAREIAARGKRKKSPKK